MHRPVVLYLPNEVEIGDQRGYRRGLDALARAGRIEAHAFSLHREIRRSGAAAREAVPRLIRELRPDVVWLQHPVRTGLRDADFAHWRRAGDFALLYQEMDPYGRWRNRLPREARATGRAADVVAVSGDGQFRDNFRRQGASVVWHVLQSYDPDSFGRPAHADSPERDVDVVVVANRGGARLPWRGHPGDRARVRAIELLDARLGGRMTLHGRGWDLASAAGPVPFWQQGEAIARGWVSVNWDHYPDEPRYFSNRLPISLATGGIHFTTWHPGYDEVFPLGEGFLHVEHTPERLVDAVVAFLRDTAPAERLRLADRGRAWARDHLSQPDVGNRLLDRTLRHLGLRLGDGGTPGRLVDH